MDLLRGGKLQKLRNKFVLRHLFVFLALCLKTYVNYVILRTFITYKIWIYVPKLSIISIVNLKLNPCKSVPSCNLSIPFQLTVKWNFYSAKKPPPNKGFLELLSDGFSKTFYWNPSRSHWQVSMIWSSKQTKEFNSWVLKGRRRRSFAMIYDFNVQRNSVAYRKCSRLNF